MAKNTMFLAVLAKNQTKIVVPGASRYRIVTADLGSIRLNTVCSHGTVDACNLRNRFMYLSNYQQGLVNAFFP